jgi:hypothetical protein
MPRKRKFLFASFAVVLFFFAAALLLELGSLAYFYIHDPKLPAVSEMLAKETNAYQARFQDPGCSWGDRVQTHPYLGYVYARQGECVHPRVNTLGLFGSDLPMQKDPSEHVILLVGGSVAEIYGDTGLLSKALNSEFAKGRIKRFKVFVGSAGAWKRTQHYVLFMLMANRVDTVISIDGFNEHFNLRPGSVPIENPLLDVRQRDLPAGVGGVKRALGFFIDSELYRLQRNSLVFRNSRFLFLVTKTTRDWARTFGKDDDFVSTGVSLLQDGLPAFPKFEKDFQNYNFRQLSFYLRAIHAVSKAHGVKAFHFLQPVPVIGKELTPDETKANRFWDYRELYLRQEREFLALKTEGLNVFSLTNLFVQEKENIYVDEVHFNTLGNELLNRRILDHLRPYLNSLLKL